MQPGDHAGDARPPARARHRRRSRCCSSTTLHIGPSLRNTLLQDKIASPEEAILEIYQRLRPGDPPTLETATTFFNNLFFNPDRYDLSRVGRLKLNHKLRLDAPLEQGTLRREDILEVVRYLIELKNGNGQIDDIDHLGNRRVRAVGELVENQYRIGLVRMERAIKERMSLQDIETLMPQELINYKPVSAVIKEFFGSSQLSQFMDQTNPLSEITHKRRLSALGPGGLTRERAGFEVRDVHPTHYGRVCPIETPEGPNIGLIASLSTYARVNDFGFVETPYREVENGRVTDAIHYLSALEEEEHVIAQANAPLDAQGRTSRPTCVSARTRRRVHAGAARPGRVHGRVAEPAGQRRRVADSVPRERRREPRAHGLEHAAPGGAAAAHRRAARRHRHGARRGARFRRDRRRRARRRRRERRRHAHRRARPTSRATDGRDAGVDIYNLIKYQRSNQNTCINQRPIVVVGDRVQAGDVIADGPSTEMGELALGRNVLVAFMPWGGYNFEDSILISERVVKEDYFTSIHIEEFECVARDTKLGPEEITRDIPNVGEEALKDLDESRHHPHRRRGEAGRHPGRQDHAEGRDAALARREAAARHLRREGRRGARHLAAVPPGVEGTVINARVFSRKGVTKDERSRLIEEDEVARAQEGPGGRDPHHPRARR